MGRCDIREGLPERAHRLGRCDRGGWRQQRRPARDSRHGHRPFGEAQTLWAAFLRKLARRGLRVAKLVISDAHEGIKGAKVLNATWQRCRVHFTLNVLAHSGRQARRLVSAFIATAFAQDDAVAARAQWRRVADQLRLKLPNLDEPEADVLAYIPSRPSLAPSCTPPGTNPIERLNGEIKRRTSSASSSTRTPLSASSAPS
jgi:transposase-like protein